MKAAEPKAAGVPAKKSSPFFSKDSEQSFFGSKGKESSFFSKPKNLIQTKLAIGQPNDIYEKEADAKADKVVQRLSENKVQTKRENNNFFFNKNTNGAIQQKPDAPISSVTPFLQTKCSTCKNEEKLQKKEETEEKDLLRDKLQKKPIFESNVEPPPDEKNIQRKCSSCEQEEKLQKKSDLSPQTASANIESSLSSSKGFGSPLPHNTRGQMESSFGADFSGVRIHNDSSSVQMNKDLHAQAFTHGSDIYFNSGKYNTNSNSGKHLLAHELTHVLQQRGIKTIQRQPATISSSRQDVVYVMGRDTFHRIATRFFRARFPRATFATLTNLEAVLVHLNNTFNSPLGNIFIVSHANEDGTLAFGLNARDRDHHLTVVELRNALHPSGGGSSTLTDVSHLIDSQTRVQIKGCDLGRNQQVVELFDEAFGGAGVVTAPTHEQFYSENSAEIRRGTEEAMRSHLTEFEQTLPALAPRPAPIPRGLRGQALREARTEFAAARRLRATAESERRRAIARERRRFATEAARLGQIAGTHEALSGPMFQRPGTTLFTAGELQPQINSLYPHLSAVQRTSLATRLVAADRRPRARAMSQGVYRQSGQRAYSYSATFRFSAPQNLAEAQRAFARSFRRGHFTPVDVQIASSINGTATTFEYSFTGHDSRRGHRSDQMTYTATSAPVESNAALIAQVQAQVNNPDKFRWRIEENRSADGTITKTVIRERVVAYLHHGSLNVSAHEFFSPPESDRRFYAESTFPRVQPKPIVGALDDSYEKEADSMADKVLQRSFDKSFSNEENNTKSFFTKSITPVQRKCTECEQEEKLQKKSDSTSQTASPNIETSLNSSKGFGSQLPDNIREQMESSFGADFSGVRIHNDSSSVQMNKDLNAQAFTHGSDIYFNSGKYDANSNSGKHLLAHELTHVVQQQNFFQAKKIQRVNTFFGPSSTGAPADWSQQVAAATTSAQKAALIRSAVGATVTVNDRTTQSASDASPTASHLTAYTASAPAINYDENLNTKTSPVNQRSLAPNAGYTLHSGSSFYIVLGPLSIKADDFYWTVVILNHEFDHVQQDLSGSTLAGNESELDAWTSTFLREFHRTYILGNVGGTGTNCFVQSINQFMPLQFYYQKPDVSATQRDAAIARITTYYTGTIAPHASHSKVFKFWIHRMLRDSSYKDLVTRLNTDLTLGITSSDRLATTRQFPCTGITTATFPSPTSLNNPTFPAASVTRP